MIQGGEQFLPFARSCVAKLKRLGLPYADQSYEVDGASIKVRIEPGHEYIRIEGGEPLILSGVVKAGDIVTIPADGLTPSYNVLRAFKPTQNCWDFPMKKPALKPVTSFNDEARLANAGTQYKVLRPTVYSGLMAKAVQIIMGRGRQVLYDYRWAKCHGITRGPDGKLWLIQISADGVMAMALPLDKSTSLSSVDAVKQARLLFGGVPSGVAFPTGTKLSDAIIAGTVKMLRYPARMTDFYGKSGFASTMGWSFNDAGTEAHNTCWGTDGINFTSYHYRLDINFFTNNDPPVAELVLVSQGALTSKQYTVGGVFFNIPLYIYDHLLGAEVPIPQRAIPYNETDVDGTAPLIACHVNSVLEVLSVKVRSASSYASFNTGNLQLNSGILPDEFFNGETSYRPGRSIIYTSQPDGEFGYLIKRGTITAVSTFWLNGETTKAYTITTTARLALAADGTGGLVKWGPFCRDGFIVFETPSTTFVLHGGNSWSISDSDAAAGLSASDIPASNFDPQTQIVTPGFVWVYTGNSWIPIPSHTDTSETRPVKFVIGLGQAVTLPNSSNEWGSFGYINVTYSVFGSPEQQVAIASGYGYYALGGLLPAIDVDPRSESFTFLGYT